MFASKTNRIAIYVSAFFVVALVLFALLRDNADGITLNDALKILENKSVEKVVVTKEYVYLKTADNYYKIASSQVTPKMFAEYQVEIGSGSNFLVYLLFLLLFLGIASLLYKFWEKRGGSLELRPSA
ncbi:MAG: ATP-dependent metallopeptidase FtsH/Yme1/Tma family protein, partial [Thiovulaceae bacterium]|nr:ATP-dependent metallopeptidase FtsH/Yme1/Tma family protein [Sulfurimonadaceae bacterium]